MTTALLLCLLPLVGEPPAYFPAAATPTESLLPADTIAMATMPSAAKFRSRWNVSSFGVMAADPAFGPFFDDVRTHIETLSRTLGFDVQSVWNAADGELSLGLTRGEERRFTLVGIANFDADESAAAALIDRLERQLAAAGSQRAAVEADTRTLVSWTNPSDRSQSLAYYRQDGHVVFADRLPALVQLASRESTDREVSETLGGSEAYQKVKSQTRPAQEAAAIRWYVNPAAAVDAVLTDGLRNNPNLNVVRGLLEQSGINQFRGFGGLFDLPGTTLDSVSSTYGYVEGEPRGLLKALAMPASPQRPPRWVKDDVSLYSQMNWSPGQLVDVVRSAVDSMRGEGTFEATIASQPLAGDVTAGELLAQFDGPLHFAAEVPQSAEDLTRQATIISLGIKDAAATAALLQRLAGETPATTVGDATIYTLDMPFDVPAGTPLESLRSPQLAVTVAEGQLMLSTDGAYLERTVAGIGSGRALVDSPEYREIAQNFPEQTAVINFQRQDERFEGMYEQLRAGGMPAVGTLGVAASVLGFDFTKLPPFPAMSRYLQNTGGYIVPAEDGFRVVNFSLEPRER